MKESMRTSIIELTEKKKGLLKEKHDIEVKLAGIDYALEQLDWIETSWKVL